jgi:hypothetical protein
VPKTRLVRLLLVGGTGQPKPKVPPWLRTRENHSYVLSLERESTVDSLKTARELDAQGPTRRGDVGLASPFEGLLKAQDADQGGGYRLRTGRERHTDSCATVALVEVRARGKRHAMFFQ